MNGDLSFSCNSYGVGQVDFSNDKANEFCHTEVLDFFIYAYVQYHMFYETGLVKETLWNDDKNILLYEETKFWETGYSFKFITNRSEDHDIYYSQAYKGLFKGVMIRPNENDDNHYVSRSQFAFKVGPRQFKGGYIKMYNYFDFEDEFNELEYIHEDEE